jgi:hypothetical protein
VPINLVQIKFVYSTENFDTSTPIYRNSTDDVQQLGKMTHQQLQPDQVALNESSWQNQYTTIFTNSKLETGL